VATRGGGGATQHHRLSTCHPEGCMAYAINHTCHPGFANCRFVHAGIKRDPLVGGWSEDEPGGIGGRRTSEVFVS
jgi:hypothetical protein